MIFFFPKPYPSSSCGPAQRMPDSIWLGSGPAVPVLAVRSYFLIQEPPRTTFLLCSNCPAPLSSPPGIQWISVVWWWGNPTQASGLGGLVSHCTNANVEWNKRRGKGPWGAHGLRQTDALLLTSRACGWRSGQNLWSIWNKLKIWSDLMRSRLCICVSQNGLLIAQAGPGLSILSPLSFWDYSAITPGSTTF